MCVCPASRYQGFQKRRLAHKNIPAFSRRSRAPPPPTPRRPPTYVALLTALLAPDGERLRRESAASRAAAVDFVATRAGGLRALLAPLVDEATLPPEGGGCGVIGALRAAGRKVVNVAREVLVPPQRSEVEAVAELRAGMEKLGMPTGGLEAMLQRAHAEWA